MLAGEPERLTLQCSTRPERPGRHADSGLLPLPDSQIRRLPIRCPQRWSALFSAALLKDGRHLSLARYLPAGARVLDVGCHDGELFHHLGSRLSGGVGLDPGLEETVTFGPFQLVPGRFPQNLPEADPFDAVTMLAVLEHLQPADQRAAAAACRRCLRPGGCVIVTVPSPRVDRLVDLLQRLRLAHGMALEEHYGFRPEETPKLFHAERFETQAARRFQLGLNHLYVFRKPRD